MAEIFGTTTAYAGLAAFARRIGAPASLAELGLTAADLPRAVDLSTANPYWNCRPVEREAITALIARAFAGEPAQP